MAISLTSFVDHHQKTVDMTSLANHRVLHRPTFFSSTQLFKSSGFTLLELLVVCALLGIVVATVSIALRDPSARQLETEAQRLSALLESARADARVSGVAVQWFPHNGAAQAATENEPAPAQFEFTGVSPKHPLPVRWINPDVVAQVQGSDHLVLGPEPLIGAQSVVLSLHDQSVTVSTDGLGPFALSNSNTP